MNIARITFSFPWTAYCTKKYIKPNKAQRIIFSFGELFFFEVDIHVNSIRECRVSVFELIAHYERVKRKYSQMLSHRMSWNLDSYILQYGSGNCESAYLKKLSLCRWRSFGLRF